MNLVSLRKAVRKGNYEWKKHTLIRLAERNISQDAILEVILKGEVIEDYPEDQPFSYEPTLGKFELNFRTRRK